MSLDKKVSLELCTRAIEHLEATDPGAIEWARGVGEDTFKNLRTKGFLRQYCFVVYASGFKFATVKACFPALTESFHNFDIKKLAQMKSIKKPLKVFNNERKAQNFLDGAKMISNEGFSRFKKRMKRYGAHILTELPGIGAITKDHLSKNIGLSDVAKADVWLIRAAEICGADSVSELVDYLHHEIGESRHVIDVAIWALGRDGLLHEA